MRPTDVLRGEHRVIEQVLSCLEAMARECRRSGRLDGEMARKAVRFFRSFADGCHHAKEERHLFPAMESRGFPRDGGPTGVMRIEHEQGRAAVRALDTAIEAASAGDAAALERFSRSAESYVELLREHIRKEDHCLFPMAEDAFTADDERGLQAAFESVEEADVGAGVHEEQLAIADELAARYGVPRAAAGALPGGCGCRHGGAR